MKTSRNIGRFLTTVVVVTVLACTANGRTIYVDDDAAGANDGSSWTNAYKFLQDALAVAVDGDEIMVAQGTYRPDQGNGQGLGDRTATFRLMNGVTIIGGYAGVSEQNPDAHDVELYKTILSGDLKHNDVVGFDPNRMVTEPTRSDNSYHIVNAIGTDANAVLDGFIITGGSADGTAPDSVADKGGGILIYDGAAIIINCTINFNSAYSEDSGGGRGGGVYIENGSPIMTNCTFNVNAANGIYGGGLYIHNGSPTLTNCTFSENLAGRSGGGIYNGGNPILNDCTFIDNSAGQDGGGMASERGNPVISNCIFEGNQTGWSGGGAFCQGSGTFSGCTFNENTAAHGGGLYHLSALDAVIEDCMFTANQCIYEGAALALDTGNANIVACKFQENVAQWNGGAIMIHPAEENSHKIIHCEFVANTTLGHGTNIGGGAIMDRGNETAVSYCVFEGNRSFGNLQEQSGLGGAVYCNGAATTLINCTFAGNFANAGCALACDAYETPGDAIVSNCIMWDDGEEIWIGPDSIASITYSDIQVTDGEVYPGPNNININPNFTLPGHWSDRNNPNLLLDPGNADAIWVAGDYQLLEGSPCVNAGDNSAVPEWIETDLKGRPRIIDDIVDIGAYEFTKAVYFADPNLKASVEEGLGIKDPTPDDMLALQQLHASDRGITDLTGIEFATNLWLAELSSNQISDISPLSSLINLTGLNIERNQIFDLSPLSNLTGLTELISGKNQISDLGPLTGLDNLKLLYLDGNLISDLSPLSALTINLDTLWLQHNQISDISPLSSLTNLSSLQLYSNQISDISPLRELINLTALSLEGNPLGDLAPLSELTNLTSLHLARTQTNDLTPLAGLTNLTALYLYGNQISDISIVSNLKDLTQLWLSENQISDISPLNILTNLTSLRIQSNPLDWPAYYVDIPLIVANNPNLTPENFLYDHKIAYDSYPHDGAGSMDPNLVLSWMPSMTGENHDIYFGDNFADVNNGTGDTFRGNQTETSFIVGMSGSPYPDGLVPGKTYYWRIDELNAEGTIAKGQIWSFTVAGPSDVTIESQVSANEDDGYASNDQLQNLSSANLKVGSSSFAQPPYYASGMVFRNVSIPQGAEILSAHLRIRSYNSRLSDEVYGRIQAEATDDALGFGAFGNIGTLPRTTALVDWDLIEPWAADTWYTSPDIAGVVQEVVDRGGWVEGNSLAIIYSTRENMGGYRSISSFDRGSDSAPILEITYVP